MRHFIIGARKCQIKKDVCRNEYGKLCFKRFEQILKTIANQSRKTKVVVKFANVMENEIDKKLKSKNINPTAMRQLVFEVLVKHQKAMSLFEIEQQFDNVERSTIFRTLKTFQDNYLIHSIDDGTGAVKYALCDDGCICNLDELHIHFLCYKCGQTHCMKDLPIPQTELPEGFIFESANFVIKGICPNCN